MATIGQQKVILLFGSRRTGKTTIIDSLATQYGNDVLMLQGEDMQINEMLNIRTIANYQQLTRGKKLIIIDEAQAVQNIGPILKLMIDQIKNITIIATGSSSLDINNYTGEPLVGRNVEFQLYPIAQCELASQEDYLTTIQNQDKRLIYGSYPELWQLPNDVDKTTYLRQLVNSYLLKDLLTIENVKGSDIMHKLLQLLAWQVGSEVSTTELGNALQISKNTVERYLDLLHKVFIIFPLSGYSGNLRKEVSKSKKWYFYDNGIRNAIINNFNPLHARNDIGMLWEQYIISERIKYNQYHNHHPDYHYWRTYDHQEIDLLEVIDGSINALECKYRDTHTKIPTAFHKAYPTATYHTVHRNNYLQFITQS